MKRIGRESENSRTGNSTIRNGERSTFRLHEHVERFRSVTHTGFDAQHRPSKRVAKLPSKFTPAKCTGEQTLLNGCDKFEAV